MTSRRIGGAWRASRRGLARDALGARRVVALGVLGAILAMCPVGSADAKKKERPGYLNPKKLLKLTKKSENTYVLASLDQLEDVDVSEFAEVYWPSTGGGLRHPWIDIQDGSRDLLEYPLEAGCLEIIGEGEALFEADDYAAAAKVYQRAIDGFPECYVAYSHLGDCHYFRGELERALPLYDKAASLNPFDFRTHFYRANTLARLQRHDEARSSYARALALRPHRETIIQVLRANAAALGFAFRGERFQPRGLAREKAGQFEVFADEPHWMVYGLCKAVWLAEPEHREERTGNTEHNWSLVEERQCILSMVENYYANRRDETVEPDDTLEFLLAVMESERLDGFILYEMGSRLSPDIMLLLPEDLFAEALAYVEQHVVAPAAKEHG